MTRPTDITKFDSHRQHLREQAELAQSLEFIDRRMEQVATGEGRSLKDAISEIAVSLSHGHQ